MDYAATWFDVNLSTSDTNYILTQLKDNWSRSYFTFNIFQILQQITIKSLILKTIMDYAATWFDVNLSIKTIDPDHISLLIYFKCFNKLL